MRAVDAAGNLAATPASPRLSPAAGHYAAGTGRGLGFNEGAGTTVADTSGNGNTGTITGATWTTPGGYGEALSFNGTNNCRRPDLGVAGPGPGDDADGLGHSDGHRAGGAPSSSARPTPTT